VTGGGIGEIGSAAKDIKPSDFACDSRTGGQHVAHGVDITSTAPVGSTAIGFIDRQAHEYTLMRSFAINFQRVRVLEKGRN
jgi:hypothetical protein